MAILKQGPIYKYVGKGKWIDAYYVLLADERGLQLVLFKDSTAKKPLEAPIEVKTISEKLRFGYTTRQFADRVDITKKDIRIDESAFIALVIDKVVKRVAKNETIWLCATTVVEMFDLIKIVARCLTMENLKAPEPNDLEEMDSLHRYHPVSFQPENEWEKYYDSPPRHILIVPLTAAIVRSASADELTEKKTMKAIKNKNLKKQKEDSKSMTALNEISPDTRRSTVSMGSELSKQSTKAAIPSVFIIQEDALAPMQTLYRTHEACEKPPLAPKPSFRQPSRKSTSSISDVITIVSPSPVPSERKSLKTEALLQQAPANTGRTCDVEVQTDEGSLYSVGSAASDPEPTPMPITSVLTAKPVAPVSAPKPVPLVSTSVVASPTSHTNSKVKNEDFDPTILRRDAEYDEISAEDMAEKNVDELPEAINPEQRRSSLRSESLTSSVDDFEDAFSRTQSLIPEPRRKYSDLDGDLPTQCAYYNQETKMYTVEITP